MGEPAGMNEANSSEHPKQRDAVTCDEVLSHTDSRQSPTSAEAVSSTCTSSLQATRESVPQIAKTPRGPMFRPPLRRLSAGTPLSKLNAAFKSPLRTSITPDAAVGSSTNSALNTCSAQHRSDVATTNQALKAPRLRSQVITKTRPSPYPSTPSRTLSTHSSRGGRVVGGGSQDTAESVAGDIAQLREQLESVESEIAELSVDYCEDELQQYIDHLHEYNEMKDVGQLLLGKLAEVKGTTTAELYRHFQLSLDD